jgi:hypothetical protein
MNPSLFAIMEKNFSLSISLRYLFLFFSDIDFQDFDSFNSSCLPSKYEAGVLLAFSRFEILVTRTLLLKESSPDQL